MTTLTFGDLSFKLRPSAKRRTIGITVERDGQLILSTPPQVPIETLEKVVNDKRLWIHSKLIEKNLSILPPLLKNTFPGKAFTIWDAATASNWWMAWRESHL
jgi:predicted metal-dependent hydrolase